MPRHIPLLTGAYVTRYDTTHMGAVHRSMDVIAEVIRLDFGACDSDLVDFINETYGGVLPPIASSDIESISDTASKGSTALVDQREVLMPLQPALMPASRRSPEASSGGGAKNCLALNGSCYVYQCNGVKKIDRSRYGHDLCRDGGCDRDDSASNSISSFSISRAIASWRGGGRRNRCSQRGGGGGGQW